MSGRRRTALSQSDTSGHETPVRLKRSFAEINKDDDTGGRRVRARVDELFFLFVSPIHREMIREAVARVPLGVALTEQGLLAALQPPPEENTTRLVNALGASLKCLEKFTRPLQKKGKLEKPTGLYARSFNTVWEGEVVFRNRNYRRRWRAVKVSPPSTRTLRSTLPRR